MKYTRKLLENMHEIDALRFERADSSAHALYIDLIEAIDAADLNDREDLVVTLRYFVGMTGGEAAAVMGVNKSTISRNEREAVRKINEVLGKE